MPQNVCKNTLLVVTISQCSPVFRLKTPDCNKELKSLPAAVTLSQSCHSGCVHTHPHSPQRTPNEHLCGCPAAQSNNQYLCAFKATQDKHEVPQQEGNHCSEVPFLCQRAAGFLTCVIILHLPVEFRRPDESSLHHLHLHGLHLLLHAVKLGLVNKREAVSVTKHWSPLSKTGVQQWFGDC